MTTRFDAIASQTEWLTQREDQYIENAPWREPNRIDRRRLVPTSSGADFRWSCTEWSG